MRRAKAYSRSCSQTVSISPVISLQFILEVRCSRRLQKSIKKTVILEVQGFFKVIDVDTTKKLL